MRLVSPRRLRPGAAPPVLRVFTLRRLRSMSDMPVVDDLDAVVFGVVTGWPEVRTITRGARVSFHRAGAQESPAAAPLPGRFPAVGSYSSTGSRRRGPGT